MIYFDNNSTTRIDDAVFDTMLPFLKENYGNASAKMHALGWVAEHAVEQAREQVATTINCSPQEITFTSGATESINIAIQGLFKEFGKTKNEIIVCASEHSAVLKSCNELCKYGAKVTILNINRNGLIELDDLKKILSHKTLFVAIMLANNETGVIQDIKSASEIIHQYDSFLICDATQAIGKIDVDVEDLGIDLMPISAHKVYGPKGVGALYKRRKNPRVTIAPTIFGGGQENNLRPGTLNVAGIVGMGKALELSKNNLWDYASKTSHLRTLLEQHFEFKFGTRININGSIKNRLPNTTNILIDNTKATELLSKILSLAASTGSSCASSNGKPSHVLMAMGLTASEAFSSIRFSFGKYNEVHEVETIVSEFQRLLI